MDRPDLTTVVARARCVMGLLVRAQIEEQLSLDRRQAARWSGALERLESWLHDEGLEEALVPEERMLLEAEWGSWSLADKTAAAWRIEGLATLLYALGCIDLPQSCEEPVSPERVYAVVPLMPSEAQLGEESALKPIEELDRFRRMTGVWRWRARTELLHRRGVAPKSGAPYGALVRSAADRAHGAGLVEVVEGDFAVRGAAFATLSEEELRVIASVALERGRAADWLCGRGRWDAPSEL